MLPISTSDARTPSPGCPGDVVDVDTEVGVSDDVGIDKAVPCTAGVTEGVFVAGRETVTISWLLAFAAVLPAFVFYPRRARWLP